jgi:hypothetical protein
VQALQTRVAKYEADRREYEASNSEWSGSELEEELSEAGNKGLLSMVGVVQVEVQQQDLEEATMVAAAVK